MDMTGVNKQVASLAETGTRQQDVSIAILKKAQEIDSSTATQLIDAVKQVPTANNLPAHLGNTINTTA